MINCIKSFDNLLEYFLSKKSELDYYEETIAHLLKSCYENIRIKL